MYTYSNANNNNANIIVYITFYREKLPTCSFSPSVSFPISARFKAFTICLYNIYLRVVKG